MDNKEKNFISAVIYVHNAENRIEQFLKKVLNVLEDNFEHSEIICVNDCSKDASVEYMKKVSFQAKSCSISVLNMSYYHGLEMAMNAGVDLAIGDFVFEFDTTDSSFEKNEIMRVYRKSLEGFDIVSASQNKKAKLTSQIFYSIFERFSNLSYKLYSEEFRILSRRAINRINSMNRTVPYRKAIYANCGLKTENIMFEPLAERAKHLDKVEKKYRGRLAVDVLILFTEVGYRFSLSMTLFMMLLAVFMVLYSITVYAMSNPVAGWTTTILFLSVAFFGLFGILTIIIKYLQILVDLVFRHKRYSFESVEKLTK